MIKKKEPDKSTLKIQKGIQQPPCVNPDVLNGSGRKKRKVYSADEFISGILSGNRTILSQAITLIESSLIDNYETIQFSVWLTWLLLYMIRVSFLRVLRVSAGETKRYLFSSNSR